MNPKDFLKHTKNMQKSLNELQSKAVFVGLPKEKVGGKIYGDGRSIIINGATHEFGAPEQGIPQRSFLRAPFAIKKDKLNKNIAIQFEEITNGKKTIEVALSTVGIIAAKISKSAFTSLGYGKWRPINNETAKRKGSTQTMIDTGILRSSINWVLRDAS